ncbi:MAG: translation initiation factor IF-3 [Verrucomicrobiae bacterium]|nr:translation initiation factor IF-3 [Verrucomicrobiae bacterium]
MKHPPFQFRVNHRIRAPEVRVISEDGKQAGVMSVGAALKLAMDQGRDLVEVAADAKPPVCRIVDFGKFRYEQAKKHKGDGKHAAASKVKELKFHVNIGDHDYAIKMRHAAEFLQKGMRVKVSIYFRGREMAYQEFGAQLIERVLQEVAAFAHCDAPPRLLGKNLHVLLIPGKAKHKIGEAAPRAAAAATPAPPASAPSRPAVATQSFGAPIKIDLKIGSA